ncbi:MAG: diguanylate cyclase/phosphodiesterase with sensor(s) [Burkholderiaceae bacterium]|nr:diguanylate cyclase/phosphodiesterase with sensor(s) [Burkholderiaceae bacterium]
MDCQASENVAPSVLANCGRPRLLSNLFAQMPGTVFQLRLEPDGRAYYPYISQSVFDLYGISPESLRKDASLLLRAVHPADRNAVVRALHDSRQSMHPCRREFRAILSDGSLRWRLAEAMPKRLSDGSTVWDGYVCDISSQKELEELLWRQINFDVLTRLPNRQLFRSHLEQAMKQARRDNSQLALLSLDIDNFKDVNDTLGHDVGDRLLWMAAQRLQECVRESDIIARLGGDEFIIILNCLGDHGGVKRVSREILKRLAEPFALGEHVSHVSASIGITFYPQDGLGVEDLLRNADHAMYAAKRRGRNCFSLYTPSMQEIANNRMTLTNDLRAALVDYPFQLYYQPLVELGSGEVRKAEALIRWQHPVRGLVNPAEFISIAEETGMIDAIGNWVFNTAALQAAAWRDAMHPDFQISINLSPAQFRADDGALKSWMSRLPQLGVSGAAIAVEITEGLLLEASDDVLQHFLALRDAGIQVALDDFGTGFSSLSYLKKFDIDYIKIDRSFIQNLAIGSDDMALCEAIIVMSHKLGIKVVAEGVETEAQRDLLIAAGCDFAQGYLFSRPLPAFEFSAWLQERHSSGSQE